MFILKWRFPCRYRVLIADIFYYPTVIIHINYCQFSCFRRSLFFHALMMNESIDQKHEINFFILHLFLEIVKQGIDSMS